jgi:protein-glutamine gamma-glutamyltransferase
LPFAWWLARRLWRSRSDAKKYELKQIVTLNSATGEDSEFYRIEQQLREQGWGRREHETANDWLARLRSDATEVRIDTDALADIIELHNRYRFDPAGLDAAQRQRLKISASTWLASGTAPMLAGKPVADA